MTECDKWEKILYDSVLSKSIVCTRRINQNKKENICVAFVDGGAIYIRGCRKEAKL